MIDYISRLNPFKQTKVSKTIDEREARLERLEAVSANIDRRVIERRNRLHAAAVNLETTVKEALDGYDDFRKN